MEFNELTPEQKATARACTSPEELVALAREEGMELSDEQLEAISGGAWNTVSCALCREHDCRSYDDFGEDA